MKSNHPRLTLLGNNSGRNLGDAAILSSILDSLSQELPDAEFYVPSIKPSWTRENYSGRYKVHAVNVLPWTGSIRLLGIPTLTCFAKSDAALICDGIIFGKKLWNPAFNYLITLIFLAPLARLLRCKLICYSCGIGPFPGRLSRVFARYVMNSCDLVTLREQDSRKLAEEIGVTKTIEVTGDAAFINPVSSDERAAEIARAEGIDLSRPLLGINITSYLDTWLAPGERLERGVSFIDLVAEGIARLRQSLAEPLELVIFCTQPMDRAHCGELSAKLGCKVIDNERYLSHDIQSVMRRCSLFLGMRFHSIVLAAAVGVPVTGLLYAPKVRGFFRQIQSEEYGLELAALTPELLAERLGAAWRERDLLRARQQAVVDGLRTGARAAARKLAQFLRHNDGVGRAGKQE